MLKLNIFLEQECPFLLCRKEIEDTVTMLEISNIQGKFQVSSPTLLNTFLKILFLVTTEKMNFPTF